MKYVLLAALAVGAYFAWQKFGKEPAADAPAEAAAAQDKDKTPGANVQNRVDTLSGTAPDM